MASASLRRFVWILALGAVGIALAWVIYGRLSPKAPPAPPAPPPAAVSVERVTTANVPLTFEYAGRAAGSREVEVRARVNGILTKRLYVEGQPVKQGDVLFEIDPESFTAVQAQAKAVFNQAQADWQRAQSLFKERAISERERDAARSSFEQAKAVLTTAEIDLGYTTVTAPISGVTSQETLSEGSLVTANSSLLTRISQLDPIYVNFSAPDDEIVSQRRMIADGTITLPENGKLTAEIHFGDGNVYPQHGEVDFTDSIIDQQTGTIRLRAVVPNADNIILPGQFVRVVMKGFSKPNAIAVPDKAIMQGPQGPFVYIVNAESKATIRPVKLGALNGKIRLIESGLADADRVIVEGMIKVRPDAVVAAEEVAAADESTGLIAPTTQPAQEPLVEMHNTEIPSADTQADTKE